MHYFARKIDHEDRGKLRILIISPTWYPAIEYGGPIKSSHNDAIQFALMGFQVLVRSTIFGTCHKKYFKENYSKNYTVEYYDASSINFQSLALNRNLLNTKHNIVITQDIFWITTLLQSIIMIFSRDKKFIICPRGVLLQKHLKNKGKIKKKIFLKILSLILNFCERKSIHFVCTSDKEKQDVIRAFPRFDVRIIPNRVSSFKDNKRLDSKRSPVSHKEIIVVGRISHEKRVKLAIDVCRAASAYHNIKLTIAGPDFGCEKELKEYTHHNGLTWVKFVGVLDHQELSELYSRADCLLFTSMNENFGNVVLEAIAHNCPVVCTDDVPWQILNEDGSGLCVADSTKALLTALLKILSKDRSKYKLACINTLNKFSDPSINDLWRELLLQEY